MPLRSAAAGDRKREVPTQLRFVHAAVCTASIHSRRVASEMSGFRKRCFYIQPPLCPTLVNELSRALDAPPETVSAWISAHGVSIIQPSFTTVPSCNRLLNRRELTRR